MQWQYTIPVTPSYDGGHLINLTAMKMDAVIRRHDSKGWYS